MRWMRALVCVFFAAQAMPGLGEEPGRLFFSPAERRVLDIERRDAARGAAPVAAPVRIDGILLRSGRQGIVWIDGTARALRIDAGSPHSRTAGEVMLRGGGSERIDARVGSTVDSTAGTARDPIGHGAIAKRRR